jgi:succinate dehydrogenase flavin-adding protein (antitoxin of CptAB toxin-antitoxin module)
MERSLIQKALKGNIIEELGLESLPEEQKIELLASISELIGLRLMSRVAERLADKEAEEFAQLLEGDDVDKAFSWLHTRKIPFEEMALEEVARMKEELRRRANNFR